MTAGRTGGRKPAGKAAAARRVAPAGKARPPEAEAAGGGTAAEAAPAAEPTLTVFERFILEFIAARGGTHERVGPGDYRVTFDSALARRLRRQGARLVFDPDCALLPRGGVFVAPGSRFGQALLEAARAGQHVTRERVEPAGKVDVQALAKAGFPVHGAEVRSHRIGEARQVALALFHVTLTLRGGVAEQDLRSVLADPRGPAFEFVEPEERRSWRLLPDFPEGPVWWGDHDVRSGLPEGEAQRMWRELVDWLQRVQEQRLERWRRRCEEMRDRDLGRINAFYETRLAEEQERRRRRSEAQEEEDQATEAEIKLEWERRVRSVRARWDPQAELRLWGVEEIARPRVPVSWTLATSSGTRILAGEIDLAEGGLARLPCPACGRLVGEFWWEGSFVCRRCRGKGGRLKLVGRGGEVRNGPSAGAETRAPAPAGSRPPARGRRR